MQFLRAAAAGAPLGFLWRPLQTPCGTLSVSIGHTAKSSAVFPLCKPHKFFLNSLKMITKIQPTVTTDTAMHTASNRGLTINSGHRNVHHPSCAQEKTGLKERSLRLGMGTHTCNLSCWKKQQDCCKFKAGLVYVRSSRLDRATLKKQNKKARQSHSCL